MKPNPRGIPPYLICGLHRSGTTYVGSILSHESSLPVIHEPLNECFGVAGVPVAYPFVAEDGLGDCAQYAQLLDEIVMLDRPWNKKTKRIRARGTKRLAYALTGGSSGLRWSWLRMRNRLGMPPHKLCLKDPFATLATPYLVKRHDARVVCMVRHPAAIYYSTEKQNWWFDVDNLLRQPSLMERYAADIPEEHWEMARKYHSASIALLWKMMIRINAPLAREDDRLLLVRHEDLCLQPIETAKRICEHLGTQFTQEMERYVRRNSEGGTAEAANKRTHDFERDSRALAYAWRGKLDQADKKAIMDLIGDDLGFFYSETEG